MIEPGSLAAKVDHVNPNKEVNHVELVAKPDETKLNLAIPYQGALGNYTWDTTVFATDFASKRSLQFRFANRSYSVAEEIDLEETRRLQELERQEQLKRQQEQHLMAHRAEVRKRAVIWVTVGNIAVIVIGLLTWFLLRRRKAKKAELPEMQLDLPK
jgi:uncharacterized protein (TIGR03503 family)